MLRYNVYLIVVEEKCGFILFVHFVQILGNAANSQFDSPFAFAGANGSQRKTFLNLRQ